MRTRRVATTGASAPNVSASPARDDPRWKRVVWLLVIAAGLTVGRAHVASAGDQIVVFCCEPPEGGRTNYESGHFGWNQLIEIVATPAPCYRFLEWRYDHDEDPVYIWDPYEADTWMQVGSLWPHFSVVTAYFEKRLFNVAVCAPTNGTFFPAGDCILACNQEYSLGPATPDPCYKFKQWNTTGGVRVGDYTASITTMWAIDHGTLCAEFEKITYVVTVFAPANGTVSPSGGSHTYDCGSVISITATPPQDYKFKRWNRSGGVTVANPTAASTTMTVTGDGTLRPVFEIIISGVPNVVGMMQEDAEEALTAAGFKVGAIWWTEDTLPEGTILSQDPAGGEACPLGSPVDLTISQGSGGEPGPGTPSLVPIGHWKLDETTGTTAADSSGNNYHGTLVGSPLWQPTGGILGGALQFDGVDDYIDCGNPAALNIQDQITLACWIKVAAFTRDWETILAKGDGSYRLSRSGGEDTIHFGISGTSVAWFDGVTPVTDDEWHHVAGVYDGSQAAIYVDGVLDMAVPATGKINTSPDNLFIGENSQNRGRYLKGLVDDVRIYSRGLSESDILAAMLGAAGTSTGPVAHWRLDETSGLTALDSSGNDYHGTVSGGAVWQPTQGIVGGALQFDGVDDYIDCGNPDALNIQDQITLACWIKVAAFTRDWETILAKGDGSYRLSRSGEGNVTHFGITGTSAVWFDGVTPVTDNEWHHVAGVYDGSQAAIYVDGIPDAVVPATGRINTSSDKLFIGENSQNRGRYLKGLVDDVRIYDRALSPAEIVELTTP